MKTITFIHPDLGIGGAERLILDVASAVKKLGYKVIFLTNHFDSDHCFEDLKTDDYTVQIYGDWLPRSFFGRFQAMCAYIRMVYLVITYLLFYKQKDQPNLFFVDLIPIAIPFLKLTKEKVVYYCHHPDLLASTPGGCLKKLYRKPIDWLEMKATSYADVILVNSQYTASVFRQTFPEITKRIDIVYPTVSSKFVDDVKKSIAKPIHEIVPAIPENKNNIVFLSINRFHPAKQLDMAILAMSQLKESLKSALWEKIYFVIAGGYDPQSAINKKNYTELINETSNRKLDDKIIFLKSPSNKMKIDLLLACDCVVYTPVKEHFGIVPLEAMVVAKPVIACNSGGPKETIRHGFNGYLCEPDPQSMSQFMGKIAEQTDAYQMGLNGRKLLDEQFSYDSFVERLKNILSKLE